MALTYQQLAQQTLDVQDACNLSGVVHSFSRAMDVLWAEARDGEGRGTEWINTHPIVTLFIDKLASLNGTQCYCDTHGRVSNAYSAVNKIAAGEPE